MEVNALTGKVVGSGRTDLSGLSHDEERRSITIAGATILIRNRIDTKYFRKSEAHYPQGMKQGGDLKEWECGAEVTKVQSDQDGPPPLPEI